MTLPAIVPVAPVLPGPLHDCGGPSLSGPATVLLCVGMVALFFLGPLALDALADRWDRWRARRCPHRGSMLTQCILRPKHRGRHHYRDASGIYYETGPVSFVPPRRILAMLTRKDVVARAGMILALLLLALMFAGIFSGAVPIT